MTYEEEIKTFQLTSKLEHGAKCVVHKYVSNGKIFANFMFPSETTFVKKVNASGLMTDIKSDLVVISSKLSDKT